MFNGPGNGHFSTIKIDLENNILYVVDRYPRAKEETVRLLKNYHVSNHNTHTVPVKEEVLFSKTGGKVKINKKVKAKIFHCSDPYHWSYKLPQLSEAEEYELCVTNEKGGNIHAQVGEVIK